MEHQAAEAAAASAEALVAGSAAVEGLADRAAEDRLVTTGTKVLTQVAGHASHTIKLLPPLIITDEDCDLAEHAFDEVIAATHRVPGAIWSLGKTLVGNAVQARG